MKKQLSQRLLPSDPYSITFLWFMPRGEDRQLPLKGFFHEEFRPLKTVPRWTSKERKDIHQRGGERLEKQRTNTL